MPLTATRLGIVHIYRASTPYRAICACCGYPTTRPERDDRPALCGICEGHELRSPTPSDRAALALALDAAILELDMLDSLGVL